MSYCLWGRLFLAAVLKRKDHCSFSFSSALSFLPSFFQLLHLPPSLCILFYFLRFQTTTRTNKNTHDALDKKRREEGFQVWFIA